MKAFFVHVSDGCGGVMVLVVIVVLVVLVLVFRVGRVGGGSGVSSFHFLPPVPFFPLVYFLCVIFFQYTSKS